MPDTEFSKKFIVAVDERTVYYNSEVLPQLLEKYRQIHTCVQNIIDFLIQKSIIKPDPYKLEKNISGVELISNEQYQDSERALVIGTRLSDYEGILDFICNYYKFSIENTGFASIKKFVEFNKTFDWHSFSVTNTSPNTRGLATLFAEAKQGSTALSATAISDNIVKCDNTTKEINLILKDLSDFQKEVYKAFVRKNVFESPKFNAEKANESIPSEIAEIKKTFPTLEKKQPYYTALIEEIAKEDLSPQKEKLQTELLSKLEMKQEKKEVKTKQIDTKEILMSAVHALSGLGPQLQTVMDKITENKIVLQTEHQSFFDKLIQKLRKLFNLAEPQIIYNVSITDSTTGTVTREKININDFLDDLSKRISMYNSFSLKTLPSYQKIESNPPDKILEFLNKQVADAQRLLVQIAALDTYFKDVAEPDSKKLIRGMKMELTTMKNTLINTKQHRGDYILLVEEQAQMKKLGIEND